MNMKIKILHSQGFPGGSVVKKKKKKKKNPPASAGDTGLIPALEGSHMPQLSPRAHGPHKRSHHEMPSHSN